MINYHNQVITALNTIGLPVHYEMVLHSGLKTPCISYMQLGDTIISQTDITDISRISYQIKIWSTKMPDLQEYASKIDAVMRALNFRRVSCAELYDNNSAMMQKVLTYEAISLETFK